MNDDRTIRLITFLCPGTVGKPAYLPGRIAVAPMFFCNRRWISWRPAFRAEDSFWVSTLDVDPHEQFPWFVFHLSTNPTELDRGFGTWHLMHPGDEIWIIPNYLSPEWTLIPLGTREQQRIDQ